MNISYLKNTPHKRHLSVFTQNVFISIYTKGVFKYLHKQVFKSTEKKYLKVFTQKVFIGMSTKSLYTTVDKLLPAGSVPPITIYNGTLTQY